MNTFNDPLSSYLNNYKPDTLQIGFQKAKSQQAACFRAIDNKCSLLQDSIVYLQKTILQLQGKIREYGENKQSIKLSQLKDKQKQFIISELQKKVKRLQTNQQSLQTAVMQKQMQISELKQKNFELISQNTQIKQQAAKKVKQIKQLIKTNSTLKLAQSFNEQKIVMPPVYTPNISQLGIKKQELFNRNQYYEELQSKLKEMEDCLNGQIQQYKAKNAKLQQEIKRLHQQLQKQSLNFKRIYQLELRVKNLSNQHRNLQQSYTAQLSTTNQNEVKLHKKINELKNQIQQLKKIQKNAFKQYEKQLKKFSSNILGLNDKATIFIGVMGIGDQLSELGKQIQKWHKKQIKTVTFEKDAIIEELNLVIQDNKNKITQLNNIIQKMKIKKNQILEKSPIMNGHSLANKSNSQNNYQAKQKQKINQRVIQQKYEQRIKEILSQLDERQKFINQMRKKNDETETQMSKKQLQLQAKISEKQMELQYQEQKMNQLRNNIAQTQKTLKIQSQKQIKKIKEKIKQIEVLRDEFKNKYKQSQQKLYTKQRSIKQIQKRQRDISQKIKKIEKKYQAKQQEFKKTLQNKDKNIEQLISKNQTLGMELKLSKQKLRMTQLNLSSFKSRSQFQKTNQQKQVNLREIQTQFLIQKQQLQAQIIIKQQDIQSLKQNIQEKNESLKKKQDKIIQLNQQINKIDNDLKLLRNQNQSLKQSSQKFKQLSQKSNNFTQLRQEYQKREKLLKAQGQKIITEIKNSKKQVQAQNKRLIDQINQLKAYNSQIKSQVNLIQQQKLKFNAQKFKDSERQRKVIKSFQQKISQLNQKISQLQKKNDKVVQNPMIKNSSGGIKTLNTKKFKGTDSMQLVQYGCMTDKILKNDQGINTIDLFALQTQNNGVMNKILDLNDEPQGQVSRNSNLFLNLKANAPANDDFFEICDQNQVVNFGESQFKLQVREIFTNLRIQIEKLFNLDEISFATTKLLPQGLQDDYYQLMGYIKQKIGEIRQQNQISFIMAEPGDEPQPNIDNSFQFPGLIQRHASQGIPNQSLRKIIQQKEALINSLMNQRTSQENTINQLTMQKQQIQQQNQNRFMNQCNVYKKQIKQHKKTIDKFEMNMQSMRIVIRNVLQAYSQNQDMEDDFRQSMNLYAKVANLNQKQRSRINYYIQRYLEIKGLDAS